MQQRVNNGIGHSTSAVRTRSRCTTSATVCSVGPLIARDPVTCSSRPPAGCANGAILDTEAASITIGIVV